MEYTLNLTLEEINVLANGLGELPMKTALPILNKLQAQIKEQPQRSEPTEEEAPE